MFHEYGRDLPQVERQILDSIGPRDLVICKLVCKHWATSVRRYIRQLDANRTSDLMQRAFHDKVRTRSFIEVPQTFYDLTVNDRKEIYILGDDKIMKLDSVTFQVTKTMMFERNIWSEKEENYLKRGLRFRIHANEDGSQFLVKNPLHDAVQCWKYQRSTDLLNCVGSKTRMKYNSDAVGTKIVSQGRKISKKDLLKIKTCLNAYDIVQLGCGLCMFTIMNPWDISLGTLICVAYMSQSFYQKTIANVQMDPRYLKLRVVGTRVFCYESGIPLHTRCPENDPDNYTPRSRIVVFDIWNPASVKSEGVLTKTHQHFCSQNQSSSAEMKQLISKLNYYPSNS